MLITTVEINKQIEQNAKEYAISCENSYNQKIKDLAKTIASNDSDKKPLILISGPSGSGKTTTAIKLSKEIKNLGKNVCYISMDKYFKNFTDEERALKRQNKIDLESPDRLDSDVLNKDLKVLINGGKIDIPSYDFATNIRTRSGKTISRNNGFVIVEGIHALNPDVIAEMDDYSEKIYVSVRTRVLDTDGDKLHPCKIRLLRRVMRDKLYRKRSAEETVKMFPHVQRGENQYILPYKARADHNFDTFVPYEVGLYKNYIYEELIDLSQQYSDVRDVVNAMDRLSSLNEDIVPKDALVREFIGGSSLSY